MARQYENIPREEIPWWPTIDYDACAGCRECYEFCPNDVFDWDDNDVHLWSPQRGHSLYSGQR
ncbi:MAG TPA: ferredoxin family protein [Anaerolineae bacterium]|nr:ferredoxin family protein [Anaerolineae bacterium]